VRFSILVNDCFMCKGESRKKKITFSTEADGAEELVGFLCCEIGSLPRSFLGMPLGSTTGCLLNDRNPL
jgi:hypothetical protein